MFPRHGMEAIIRIIMISIRIIIVVTIVVAFVVITATCTTILVFARVVLLSIVMLTRSPPMSKHRFSCEFVLHESLLLTMNACV